MIELNKVQYKGKEYLYRTITILKGTDEEKTIDVAEEELSTDLYVNNDLDNEIDQQFACYPPYTCITQMNDDELAEYVENEFYM